MGASGRTQNEDARAARGSWLPSEGPALVQDHPGDRWSRSTPKALRGPPTLPPHTPLTCFPHRASHTPFTHAPIHSPCPPPHNP